MKKLAIIAALALIAGASCTKQEFLTGEANTTSSLITFEVPLVNKTATKAPIDGVTYPTSESFKVWGAYSGNALDFSSIETTSNWLNYIGTSGSTGATTSYRSDAPAAWVPTPAAYWPKAGYLTFQAVSPASFGGVVNWAAHTITSGSYTVNASNQDDILFSEITANKQEADYYASANNPDDDDNSGSHGYNGVDIKFRHALAQIQFLVKKHSQCNTWDATNNTGEKIEVLSITVKNANTTSAGLTVTNGTSFTGTYTVTNGALSVPGDFPFSENGSAYITVPENSASAAQVHFNASASVVGALVLPQTLSDNVTVDVVFRSTIGDGTAAGTNNVVSSTRTISGIKLNTLKKSDDSVVATWEAGKKYIYTLYFKENEIIFDPAVVDFEETLVNAATNIINN